MDRGGGGMSDIFAFNGSQEAGYAQPAPIADPDLAKARIPASLRRAERVKLAHHVVTELVRHYTWLSQRNPSGLILDSTRLVPAPGNTITLV